MVGIHRPAVNVFVEIPVLLRCAANSFGNHTGDQPALPLIALVVVIAAVARRSSRRRRARLKGKRLPSDVWTALPASSMIEFWHSFCAHKF